MAKTDSLRVSGLIPTGATHTENVGTCGVVEDALDKSSHKSGQILKGKGFADKQRSAQLLKSCEGKGFSSRYDAISLSSPPRAIWSRCFPAHTEVEGGRW